MELRKNKSITKVCLIINLKQSDNKIELRHGKVLTK